MTLDADELFKTLHKDLEEDDTKELIEEIKGFHTLEFELSWEQMSAIKRLISFIKRPVHYKSTKDEEFNVDEYKILLVGKAGSGKSSIISQVIAYLNHYGFDYVACAPTHKARVNLEKMTNSETLTLHQLLQLRPNIEIELLDMRKLQFECGLIRSKKSHIPRLIIIDECSMITDDLYDFINEELISKRNVKIIFIGDSCQLKGVNSDHISKVFETKDKIELTKIYRQKNEAPLLYVLEDLRKKPFMGIFKEFNSAYGSLHNCKDMKEFLGKSLNKFRDATLQKDTFKCKILTYTNNRIDSYNDAITKFLFKGDTEYNVGEFLMGYDNFEQADPIDKNCFKKISFASFFSESPKIYNSLDYIIKEIVPATKSTKLFNPELRGYNILLEDVIYGGEVAVFMLSKHGNSENLNKFINYLESIRLQAIRIKKKDNQVKYATLWKIYYSLIGYFASPINLYYDGRLVKSATLKPGYACSVHKIQGSTIEDIFVDMKDIKKCREEEELRQLQYVALSRAKNNVYILN